jgi:hypothetical protein
MIYSSGSSSLKWVVCTIAQTEPAVAVLAGDLRDRAFPCARRYLQSVSALQIRGEDGAVLAEDEHFVIDIIDFLRDETQNPLFIWNADDWRTLAGEPHPLLSLEAAEPLARLEIRFVGQTSAAPPAGEHFWSGWTPLFFRPHPSDDLDLVAAPSAGAPGELLARLERGRGIWRVTGLEKFRFEKLYFSATAPVLQAPTRRERLSPLAARS